MNATDDPEVRTCSGCGASLVTNARFCAHCGLPADAVAGDPLALFEEGRVRSDGAGPTDATGASVRRGGVGEWPAAALGVAAVFVAWFLISRPGGETEATTESERSVASMSINRMTTSAPTTAPSTGRAPTSAGPTSNASTTPSAPTTSTELDEMPSSTADSPAVAVGELDTAGWRLLVGDGQTVVEIDLGTGSQSRHDEVGAPLAVVDERLLVYRDPHLAWVDVDDPVSTAEEITEVPNLQRMLTRGRLPDRPVVAVDPEPVIWWPNNNADPQTWLRLRLADGAVLDTIALTGRVFGGPDIVATIGSGTFERIDRRWERLGDFFASSASRGAVIGQRCDRPDACHWVLLRRTGPAATPERLPVALGGPFDLRLVSDADRILLLRGDGVTDHDAGRLHLLTAANADSMTAVNRSHLLAVANGSTVDLRSSVVTVVDLDGPPGRSTATLEIDDLVPRWLVLVSPGSAP